MKFAVLIIVRIKNAMKVLSVVFMFVLLLVSCSAQQSENYTVLSFEEYKKQISGNQKIQLIDVRTPEEYANGHIENAVNINVNDNNFVVNAEKLDKEKPVYIYCRSGARSRTAGAKLEKMGFKEIYDLKGGILYWSDKIVK